MPNRDGVVNEAKKWIDVPWRHQGRNKLGIDCAGLVILVGKSLGLVDYDTTNYQRRTHGQDFINHFRKNMKEKPIIDALPGDILLFRDKQYPCHCAIVGEIRDMLTIIHANALRKKVIEERLNQGDWLGRRMACFKYIGLDD